MTSALVFTAVEAAAPTVVVHILLVFTTFITASINGAIRTDPPAPFQLSISTRKHATEHCQTRPGSGDMVKVVLGENEPECSSYMCAVYCACSTRDYTCVTSHSLLFDPTRNRTTQRSPGAAQNTYLWMQKS